ncbi:MAG: type II secretion system protein J [Eubacterium sp.]
MKRTPAKRSSLFLLELIIAILFFSLTSAVCVQFFARAHQISRQTQELNAALEKVSGCTEIFLSGGDFTDIFGDRVSCTRQPDGSADCTLCYDSSPAALHTCGWSPCHRCRSGYSPPAVFVAWIALQLSRLKS